MVPEKIDYTNLGVYEQIGSLLTSIVATANVYIPNVKKEPVSLFGNISNKVLHFISHVKTQTKVTQLSSLKSMFIPLMHHNLILREDVFPIMDNMVDLLVNIGEGETEGIMDLIKGLIGLISKISTRFHGKKEYLLGKLIEAFTAAGKMEEEGANEHSQFEKVKGTKGKIIMNWIASTVES